MKSMVYFIPSSQRKIALASAQADEEPVLVIGGSGTGKGALAKWIHQNSPRAALPCLMSTRERTLAEQIRDANGGTLILDDITNYPVSEQLVLLNFLKTKSVPYPQKDKSAAVPMIVNVRIIATSVPQIDSRARAGMFNDELLLRLSKNRIEMPALVDREDEFEDIAMGILQEITHELHKEYIRGFSEAVWRKLREYDWPGNLRELRNVLRMATVACETERLDVKDLPDFGHDKINFQATRSEFEKIYLSELLKSFQHDLDKVARAARMERVTLLEKLKRLGLMH
ncbi:MAG: sigma-54-dependent Fis family transcriptional regulator [Bdellovibrionales bacterium]|nr:sigma-54-dependent Fis family transcriptional regulator [Bdellovibrionales bacterium]